MVKAILTDIEGTTSSISFVRDVLFPYAAQHMPMYLRANSSEPQVAEQLAATAAEAGLDAKDFPAILQTLLDWIAQDKKATPLKALQGLLWEHGYRNKDYKAHVYQDAFEQLQAWHAQGLPLYVYSSGSIHAQKLFFGYSEFGDMTGLFSGNYDTTSGHKQEQASYERIAQDIGLPAGEIVFLSDIYAELEAAKAAGMQTVWLVREQDTSASAEEIAASAHPVVTNFAEIVLN